MSRDVTSSDGKERHGVACMECEHGRVVVADAIYAECDNCDAAFERNEVGL